MYVDQSRIRGVRKCERGSLSPQIPSRPPLGSPPNLAKLVLLQLISGSRHLEFLTVAHPSEVEESEGKRRPNDNRYSLSIGAIKN